MLRTSEELNELIYTCLVNSNLYIFLLCKKLKE